MNRTRCSVLALTVVVLALSAGFMVTPEVHAQQPRISMESLTVPVGNQGTAALQAADIAAPGLGAWLVDITYNPAAVSVVSCTPLQQLAVCNDALTPDTIRLAGVNTEGLQGAYSLASVVFQCNSDAISDLTLSVQRFVDTGFNAIAVSVQNGTITCGTPIQRGDVNCDHAVTSIDAALVLQFAAGLLGSLACQAGGDANSDGVVNAVDAAVILQFDAGLIHSLPS